MRSWSSSEGPVRFDVRRPPETAGFVGEQRSRPARLLVVRLSSERARQTVRRDCSYAKKQKPSLRSWSVVPSGRPTPELGDVRFNGGTQERADGAPHDRRTPRMHESAGRC